MEIAGEKAKEIAAMEGDRQANELLQIHKIWQYGVKTQINVDKVNKMFGDLYRIVRKNKVLLFTPNLNLLISNYYSYYYHYFIYLSSTILDYANHVTLSVRRHSSIELWRMCLISVSK